MKTILLINIVLKEIVLLKKTYKKRIILFINNGKETERLSQRITNMESSIKEILQKNSQIEIQLSDKSEISLSNISSSSSLNIPQILELSYTKGKRYEITLGDTLVTKTTEKLKSKYNLESIDLSKTSTLIEIILFDYINFEK